jgi:hypothetical protein
MMGGAKAHYDGIVAFSQTDFTDDLKTIRGFREMLVTIREKIAALKRQGRSRDEAVAAKPTAAFDAEFGNFVIDPGFITKLVYEGL